MNRRHFLATALAAPLAAPATVQAKFDKIIEPVRPPACGQLIYWRVEYIDTHAENFRRWWCEGLTQEAYDQFCREYDGCFPSPRWQRCTTTRRAYPPPKWEPISLS